jgi:hypothetical protein
MIRYTTLGVSTALLAVGFALPMWMHFLAAIIRAPASSILVLVTAVLATAGSSTAPIRRTGLVSQSNSESFQPITLPVCDKAGWGTLATHLHV